MSEMSKRKRLRAAMLTAVTPRDIFDIVKLQVFLAKRGDPLAVREVLDRVVGKPGEDAVAPDQFECTSILPSADDEARQMDATILGLPAPEPQSCSMNDVSVPPTTS